MVLALRDRKLYVDFNHYKTLSYTQRLNQIELDKLAGGEW